MIKLTYMSYMSLLVVSLASSYVLSMVEENPLVRYFPSYFHKPQEPESIFFSGEMNLSQLLWNSNETSAVLVQKDKKEVRVFDFTVDPINYCDVTCETEIESVCWSPNNRFAVLSSSDMLYIFDSTLKKIVVSKNYGGSITWSPTSEYICVKMSKVFKLIVDQDAVKLDLQCELSQGTGRDEFCIWHSNNRFLGHAFISGGNPFDSPDTTLLNIFIWDIEHKRIVFTNSFNFPWKFSWSRGPLQALMGLFCNFPGNLAVIHQFIEYLKSYDIRLYSPDSRYIFFTSPDRKNYIIWDNILGKLASDLVISEEEILTWSSDSRYLLMRNKKNKFRLLCRDENNRITTNQVVNIPYKYNEDFREINFIEKLSKLAFKERERRLIDHFIKKLHTRIFDIPKKEFEKNNIPGSLIMANSDNHLIIESTVSEKYHNLWCLYRRNSYEMRHGISALVMSYIVMSLVSKITPNMGTAIWTTEYIVSFFISLLVLGVFERLIESKIILPTYCIDVYTQDQDHVLSLNCNTKVTHGKRESLIFYPYPSSDVCVSSLGRYISNSSNIYKLTVPQSIKKNSLLIEKYLPYLCKLALQAFIISYVYSKMRGHPIALTPFIEFLMIHTTAELVFDRIGIKNFLFRLIGMAALGYTYGGLMKSLYGADYLINYL